MTAILGALRWDVIVQARNGFYWASAFLIIVISALLLSLPASARANSAVWVPAILVINLQITTFFFMGGLMLLERDKGMLNALAVPSLSPSGYLVMRTVSLTGLAAAETIAIVWIGFVAVNAFVDPAQLTAQKGFHMARHLDPILDPTAPSRRVGAGWRAYAGSGSSNPPVARRKKKC